MTHPSQSAELAAHSSIIAYRPTHSSGLARQTASSLLARLSVSQMTTCRWSFLEDVIYYQRAGLHRMAVWRPKLCDFGEERSIELVRDAGIEVTSLGWAGGFTGSNGHTFTEAVDDARGAVRTAAALGAESLTIISGAQHGHIRTHARRLVLQGLRAVLDLAGEFGVTLALQPMHAIYRDEWTFLNSLDETVDLLREIDHPYLRMAFGTYHLWQEPQLTERLPGLIPLIASVQLSDWRTPRCDNDRHLPGEGVIPLSNILAALEAGGYCGPYEMEIWSSRLWKSDHQQLLIRSCERFVSLFRQAAGDGELTAGEHGYDIAQEQGSRESSST